MQSKTMPDSEEERPSLDKRTMSHSAKCEWGWLSGLEASDAWIRWTGCMDYGERKETRFLRSPRSVATRQSKLGRSVNRSNHRLRSARSAKLPCRLQQGYADIDKVADTRKHLLHSPP